MVLQAVLIEQDQVYHCTNGKSAISLHKLRRLTRAAPSQPCEGCSCLGFTISFFLHPERVGKSSYLRGASHNEQLIHSPRPTVKDILIPRSTFRQKGFGKLCLKDNDSKYFRFARHRTTTQLLHCNRKTASTIVDGHCQVLMKFRKTGCRLSRPATEDEKILFFSCGTGMDSKGIYFTRATPLAPKSIFSVL